MHILRRWLCLILIIGAALPANAFHIIGGEITYRCLGGGRYHFTMKIFRDCRSQPENPNVAPLDDPAFIAIYIERGGVYQVIGDLSIDLKSEGFIQPPEYPCLILPENLCVQEGIYEFEFTFPEWPSQHSYHIIYQRCCRNSTIVNIAAPATIGATYHTEITPESQKNCNNSPIFSEFPPTVVCVNSDINFNHSAIDEEGDSLVYSFCSPFQGGGRRGVGTGGGDPFACDGVSPRPACPPPFQKVAHVAPYFFDAPMGGDPMVQIDAASGLIHGVPQVIGQFVIGVCVKEFRGDTLLGELKRDFQFNVADCDPLVFAKIKSDAKIGEKSFVVNSCGENTITFTNESQLTQFISSYRWEFDIQGNLMTLTDKDATVTFPGIGEYRGVMMVNPGTDCGDTADIYVNLYPDIDADFSFDYDTCSYAQTLFNDMSYTGSGMLTNWEWSFGEGGTSEEQNPSYLYPIPGNHKVSLTVTDVNECVDVEEKIISYYPVPPLIIIEPSTFLGCAPGSVFFNNLSVPIDSTYDIVWDFGDGTFGEAISPTHTFEDPGVYTISVDITSPIGCMTSARFPNWIEIKESPKANFSFSPDEPSNFNPTVFFTNQSERAARYTWIFGADGRSAEVDPVYTFPDTGLYNVALIAIHENGCSDTLVRELDVLPKVTYFMPNAFTPNGDGKNDVFIGKGFVSGMQQFEFTIWNRWGELLYETNNPSEAWNGRKNNQGEILPNGVYIYVVQYVDPRGEEFYLRGFATLVK